MDVKFPPDEFLDSTDDKTLSNESSRDLWNQVGSGCLSNAGDPEAQRAFKEADTSF